MKIFACKRWDMSALDTLGAVRNEDGNFRCLTMECPPKNNQQDISCILPGEYLAEKQFSHHFGTPVWMLKNVQGREFIEIHPANRVSELKGCVALGYSLYHFTKPDEAIGDSRAAFNDFMELTQDDTQIKWVVEEV